MAEPRRIMRVIRLPWRPLESAHGDYCAGLDDARLPVMHGIALTPDQLVRRAVIQSLICRNEVSMESVGIAYLIDFRRYFAAELEQLAGLARDGLVELDGEWITVTREGRPFVRAVCGIFSHDLQPESESSSH